MHPALMLLAAAAGFVVTVLIFAGTATFALALWEGGRNARRVRRMHAHDVEEAGRG